MHARRVRAGILLLVAAASPALARSLAIERFDVDVTVSPDATIEVTEILRPRFEGAWNGLYRTIPVEYRTPQGFGYRLFLEPVAITDAGGQRLRYDVSSERHYRKFKVWIPDARDANRTIVFRYRVRNGLKFFEDHDELYWNVTGDEWEVPIEAASARIHLPAGASELRAVAFTGAYGSRAEDADVRLLADGVDIRMRRPLAFREGLTAVVGWGKGLVREPGALERAVLFLRGNSLLLVPLGVLVWMGTLWYRRGRDPRLRPLVPRYEPPDGLTPAEVGTLTDGRADTRDITATLVDLAVRGFVVIEEHEHAGLLGLWASRDYTFRRAKPAAPDLKPHERALLDGLFAGHGDAVDLSQLQNEFYRSLPGIRDRIFAALLGRRYYARRPDRVQLVYAGIGIGVIILAFVASQAIAAAFHVPVPAAIVAGSLSGIIIVLFGRIMPARTTEGARALESVLGFEEFLTRVESDRLERVVKTPEMFEKYLPFAMALGVERRWARAFEGICREQPGWYRGPTGGTFQPGVFVDRVSGMSRSAGMIMASQPRSSGGGSGFGGGGGSGGGFGGGGGGGF